MRGFTVYGDYSQPDPQRDLVDAVADGRVDVAVVWGPLAGYYARRQPAAIDVVPVTAERDGPALVFRVRYRDGCPARRQALRAALDAIIVRRRVRIRRILTSYGVPLR